MRKVFLGITLILVFVLGYFAHKQPVKIITEIKEVELVDISKMPNLIKEYAYQNNLALLTQEQLDNIKLFQWEEGYRIGSLKTKERYFK